MNLRSYSRVAVLGAGIMGGSTALLLARRGASVTLFDAAPRPFSGASRWNEGKIHLGFLYSADPTMRTLERVLPGGLLFAPLLRDLIGASLRDVTTPVDDIYLCHRDSVVPSDAMQGYLTQAARHVARHPDARRYLVDVSACVIERLSPADLDAVSGAPEIVAGFRVPERSVSTTWVADRFVEALDAEPRVEQRMGTRVTAARPATAGDPLGRWVVQADGHLDGPFDAIVNALWEGRLAIDAAAGIAPTGVWTNRYRLSLFARTARSVDAPSAVIATGPFGDVKNYDGRSFYMSWYPAGLRHETTAVQPPPLPPIDDAVRDAVRGSILRELGRRLPAVDRIAGAIEHCALEGGWVHASGQGSLADPAATLHRRSDFGVRRLGRYVSVDTGKYSTAPWLAAQIADFLVAA